MNVTSTLNWDTVFAMPISKINETIKSPDIFDYDFGSDGKVRGEFGKWEIVTGGEGPNIRFKIPLKNVEGTAELLGDYFFERTSVVVEVKLNFLPHKDPSVQNLKVLKVKAHSEDENNPVVTYISCDEKAIPKYKDTTEFEVADVQEVLGQQIQDGLAKNLQAFEHEFATVNLNEKISKDMQWSWCKPSDIDYAYLDKKDGNGKIVDGVLGILCMTGGRKRVEQKQQLDPYAIPSDSVSSFLISECRILEDLVLPMLPKKFPHSIVDDFEIIQKRDLNTGEYSHVLQLKEGKSIALEPVKHRLKTYEPKMKCLSINLEDDQIIFETKTETPVDFGMTAWCNTTHYYNIKLDHNKNGEKSLNFGEAKQAIVDHGVLETENTKARKDLLLAIDIVVGLAVMVITGGFAGVVLGVIAGILIGIVNRAGEDIESLINENTSPSLDLAFANMTSPITWALDAKFSLNSATLAGPLQLAGTPHLG